MRAFVIVLGVICATACGGEEDACTGGAEEICTGGGGGSRLGQIGDPCVAPWDCDVGLACERFGSKSQCIIWSGKVCEDSSECAGDASCLGASAVNDSPMGVCVDRQYASPRCDDSLQCASGYVCLSQNYDGQGLCFEPSY